jgi:hypothetical protein
MLRQFGYPQWHQNLLNWTTVSEQKVDIYNFTVYTRKIHQYPTIYNTDGR